MILDDRRKNEEALALLQKVLDHRILPGFLKDGLRKKSLYVMKVDFPLLFKPLSHFIGHLPAPNLRQGIFLERLGEQAAEKFLIGADF
jgi:hypothetical protein